MKSAEKLLGFLILLFLAGCAFKGGKGIEGSILILAAVVWFKDFPEGR